MTDLDAAARAKAREFMESIGMIDEADEIERDLAALLTSHAQAAIAAHEGQRGLTEDERELLTMFQVRAITHDEQGGFYYGISEGEWRGLERIINRIWGLTSQPAPEAGLPGREELTKWLHGWFSKNGVTAYLDHVPEDTLDKLADAIAAREGQRKVAAPEAGLPGRDQLSEVLADWRARGETAHQGADAILALLKRAEG